MTSHVARPPVGIALPSRPFSKARRRLADLTAGTAEFVRAAFRTSHDRPRRQHHQGHREEFVENAAMAREMLRL